MQRNIVWGERKRERVGIIIHERHLSSIQHENLVFYSFVADSSDMTSSKVCGCYLVCFYVSQNLPIRSTH